jgi:hypothetical protein
MSLIGILHLKIIIMVVPVAPWDFESRKKKHAVTVQKVILTSINSSSRLSSLSTVLIKCRFNFKYKKLIPVTISAKNKNRPLEDLIKFYPCQIARK